MRTSKQKKLSAKNTICWYTLLVGSNTDGNIESMQSVLRQFFSDQRNGSQTIGNERGLQLELGLKFRQLGYKVNFEVPSTVSKNVLQTKPQKRNIDLLISDGTSSLAIELKVPLAGRVPETMFDFCADIAFIEALTGSKKITFGACVLLTNDRQFWTGKKSSGIYQPFRTAGARLHGLVDKPTGAQHETIYIAGQYRIDWLDVGNRVLLPEGKYVILEIQP